MITFSVLWLNLVCCPFKYHHHPFPWSVASTWLCVLVSVLLSPNNLLVLACCLSPRVSVMFKDPKAFDLNIAYTLRIVICSSAEGENRVVMCHT